jgi:hypothetical protein
MDNDVNTHFFNEIEISNDKIRSGSRDIIKGLVILKKKIKIILLYFFNKKLYLLCIF